MKRLLDRGDSATRTARSRRQEKRVGGKRQPGSGNQWFAKGDVVLKELLVECKRTDKESITLKLSDLLKIKIEAAMADKEAVLQLEIGEARFAVIAWDLFDYYRSKNDD